MRKSFFYVLFLLLAPVFGKAQFGYGKVSEIEEVQMRKLIVITEQPSSRVLKKLEKKNKADRIDAYKKAVAEYNDNLKKIVEKFWTFSNKGIEYTTFQEADALRKNGNKDYAVLYCVSSEMSNFSSGFNESDGLDWTWDVKDESKDRDYFDGFTQMKVSTLEDLRSKPVFYAVLTDIFPTTASLVNGVANLQTYMDVRLRKKRDNEDITQRKNMDEWVAKNNSSLKKKILLIREDFVDKKDDKYSLAEHYPYKFEIVSAERLDSVIYNKDDKYVYALVIPGINSGSRVNQVYYLPAIFGAADNEMYAYSMPSMGGAILASSFGSKRIGHRYIDAKTLDNFVNP